MTLDKMATILGDDNIKCIFLNDNDRIAIRISLKLVPQSATDSIGWGTGLVPNRPLPGPMLTQFAET